VLRGLAVSPGEVEGDGALAPLAGRRGEDEAGRRPGGTATDPGWTPLFARAAGAVVEIGGVTSHSATVVREHGLPCAANVEGALERLRDGERVCVDGSRGTVEVLG
jgi:phosphohistidine swiveling domain-containing protein